MAEGRALQWPPETEPEAISEPRLDNAESS